MGRPGLTRHRKFTRLSRLLGSEALARGSLELLWDAAYEAGDDLLGDAGDVEHVARWQGEAGALAAAMAKAGFLDRDGRAYRVHDLWDHAPDYVRKRRERERQRQAKGSTLEEPATDRSVTGHGPPNGRTRSPSPSPSPSPENGTDHGSGTPMKHPQASVPAAAPPAPQLLLEHTTTTTAPAPSPAMAPTGAKKAARPRAPADPARTYDGVDEPRAVGYLKARAVAWANRYTVGGPGFPVEKAWPVEANTNLLRLLRGHPDGVPGAAFDLRLGLNNPRAKSFAAAMSAELIREAREADRSMASASLPRDEQESWDVFRGAKAPPPPPEEYVDPFWAAHERIETLKAGGTPKGWTAVDASEWRAKNLDGRPNGATTPEQPTTPTAPEAAP